MFRTTLRPALNFQKTAFVRFNSTVKEITNLKDFRTFVGAPKVSVIDFYATWCGPCKALEPIFAALAEKAPEVQFGRVDVDTANDVAHEYGITAMPTCIFFENGLKEDTIIGANPQKLISLVKKYGKVDF